MTSLVKSFNTQVGAKKGSGLRITYGLFLSGVLLHAMLRFPEDESGLTWCEKLQTTRVIIIWMDMKMAREEKVM